MPAALAQNWIGSLANISAPGSRWYHVDLVERAGHLKPMLVDFAMLLTARDPAKAAAVFARLLKRKRGFSVTPTANSCCAGTNPATSTGHCCPEPSRSSSSCPTQSNTTVEKPPATSLPPGRASTPLPPARSRTCMVPGSSPAHSARYQVSTVIRDDDVGAGWRH